MPAPPGAPKKAVVETRAYRKLDMDVPVRRQQPPPGFNDSDTQLPWALSEKAVQQQQESPKLRRSKRLGNKENADPVSARRLLLIAYRFAPSRPRPNCRAGRARCSRRCARRRKSPR